MANFCENFLKVSHDDPEMLIKFMAACENGTIAETFCPIKLETAGFSSIVDARMGLWHSRHDFGMEEFKCKGKKISGRFRTKRIPPIGVYEALTNAGFRVKACWYEAGERLCGEYLSDSGIATYNDTNKIPKHIAKRLK